MVLWVLLCSQFHFTLLFTLSGVRESDSDHPWTAAVGLVLMSWGLDLCVVGFLIKPLFLMFHFVDSLIREAPDASLAVDVRPPELLGSDWQRHIRGPMT